MTFVSSSAVMAGLVPAIHVFMTQWFQGVDARNKPGHDESVMCCALSVGSLR
jgi:hypothetical protein